MIVAWLDDGGPPMRLIGRESSCCSSPRVLYVPDASTWINYRWRSTWPLWSKSPSSHWALDGPMLYLPAERMLMMSLESTIPLSMVIARRGIAKPNRLAAGGGAVEVQGGVVNADRAIRRARGLRDDAAVDLLPPGRCRGSAMRRN